jgi:subtilisin family serine protease
MKPGIFRSSLIACAVACALLPLAGGVVAEPSEAYVTEQAGVRYFVYFDDPGAVDYQGGMPGLERTATQRSGAKFDASRAEVVAYREYLATEQSRQIDALSAAVGRPLEVAYRYDLLFSGIAVELSAAEAAIVAAQPEVVRVERVGTYTLDTDRGPSFIGADTIWNGSNTPSGEGYRGEGMVIGVLDTGVNAAHPSFANDASCGFSAENPKLIAAKDCVGSATCEGPAPGDTDGHGSHTASTAGGNTHEATGGAMAGTELSGIAPCARLITYRVCPDTCPGDAIQAGIQTALEDQVDVVNFSISGGQNPWSPAESDRAFLDLVDAGIFVSASAGNTRPELPNPIGNVNHRGPWMLTVANSTHDRINKNAIDVAGGPQDVYGLKSDAAFEEDISAQVADALDLGNATGCTAGGAFGAGTMTGRIALIRRGDCTFEEKINNAIDAGAVAVLVSNNSAAPPIPMGLGTATGVPSLMIGQADGAAISAHLDDEPTAVATIDAETVFALDPIAGDILSPGSLRGPIGGGIEVTKPDITGPGTNIMAAVSGAPDAYDFLSGTSMSSPHLAGSAALVAGLRPSWTAAEVKSALMMTASKTGQKDFTNGTPNTGPWDADDVGSGRVDLTRAAGAGLVMHESKAEFLAAEGDVDAQRALNLPSVRNTACSPSCSWTRTVRNTLSGASEWTLSAQNITPGFDVEVSPASFSFTGEGIPAEDTIFADDFEATQPEPETQEITITATPMTDLTGAVAFGEVVLTEADDRSPDLHVTVAIKGTNEALPPVIDVAPASLSLSAEEGAPADVALLTIGNEGGSDLTWQLGNSGQVADVVWHQPQSGTSGIVSDFSTTQAGGAYTANDFVLDAATQLTAIVTPGFDNSNTLAAQPEISWAIYPDAAGMPAGDPETNPAPALWTYSAAVTDPGVDITGNVISLDLAEAGESLSLPAGTYWISVYPTYANDITAGNSPRWNWYAATQVGAKSMLISPVLFEVTEWTPTGTGGLGTAIEDTAMTLAGIQDVECGASWLSIDPADGLVTPGASQAVDVSADPQGLAPGSYEANLCIASNDPATPVVVVPVSFTVTVQGGGGNETYEQGFANVPALFTEGGWFQKNNSSPLGASTWAQGAAALAPAQDGSQTEYVLVNFNSVSGEGTLSNWMLTPEIEFNDSTTLSFYTRAPVDSNFPDRLEVRVSSTGAGTNVGAGAEDVGDFTTLLLEINPAQTIGGYPETWTQFTLTNADGIPATGSGRIAFRYFVTNAGPLGDNADIIGIDTVSISAAAVNAKAIEVPNLVPAAPSQTQARD